MEKCRFVSIFIIIQSSVLLLSGAPCLGALACFVVRASLFFLSLFFFFGVFVVCLPCTSSSVFLIREVL